MTLESGTHLGDHEILSPLGKGGMGEVYRARDTKLGREVAIKVLPPKLAGDRARIERFEREARLLASLNHPNIATLYGFFTSPRAIAEGDGPQSEISYLVMELVEGETLANLISRGIPVGEVITLFLQIAEALDAAHEKGVIHRDLKPANVVVTPDGKVKVLDFGLAKAITPESDSSFDPDLSPTISVAATQIGAILGTAAYMSPEQARGRPVDQRTDVWAFGACLFEALTGNRVFEGEDTSVILASVIKSEPDWESVPSTVHHRLRILLGRCLRKDPRQRLHHIADARIELEDLQGGVEPLNIVSGPEQGQRKSLLFPLIAASLLTAALTSFGWWQWQPTTDESLSRFQLDPATNLVHTDALSAPVISPDGRRVVYVHRDKLWVRSFETLEAKALPGTNLAERPFWSPRSDWVGYFIGATTNAGRLFKVSADGGPPTALGRRLPFTTVFGATWTLDDQIVVASTNLVEYENAELHAIDANGDQFYPWAADNGTAAKGLLFPSLLPDGKGLLAVDASADGGWSVVATAEGRIIPLLRHPGETPAFPSYSPPGFIVYQRGLGEDHEGSDRAGIWAFRFDLKTLERKGEPFLVSAKGMQPTTSRNGHLLFSTREGKRREQLAWVDASGSRGQPIGAVHENIAGPEISPDGRRIVFTGVDGDQSDIFVVDDTDRETRITLDPARDFDPAWSPDGRRIAFASYRSGSGDILAQTATGRGATEVLSEGPHQQFYPNWERRTGDVLCHALHHEMGWTIQHQRRGQEPEFLQFRDGLLAGAITHPELSPDERFLLHAVSTSAVDRLVFLTTYPTLDATWQVSEGGGWGHRWHRDGTQIFYVNQTANTLLAIPVSTQSGVVEFGRPEVVLSGNDIPAVLVNSSARPGYDVSPGGERFVVSRVLDQPKVVPNLVQNWWLEFEEK